MPIGNGGVRQLPVGVAAVLMRKCTVVWIRAGKQYPRPRGRSGSSKWGRGGWGGMGLGQGLPCPNACFDSERQPVWKTIRAL